MPDKLHDAVENLWFKGAARMGMLLLTVIGGPLFVAVSVRTYDAIDRLDKSQAKLEAMIQRIDLTATNDRANTARADETLNDRITIIGTRLTDVQRDYARTSDVKAGFDLRDQHLTTLDGRVTTLEQLMRSDGGLTPRDRDGLRGK